MSLWFLQDDARVQKERAALSALECHAPWLRGVAWVLSPRSCNLAFQADVVIADVEYPVILEYPALFPASPPSVFPREPSGRWSSHQFGPGGELCLEWGPDNWEPHISGAQVLKSAHKLLQAGVQESESRGDVVASRHQTSLGQDLRSSHFRAAITPELTEALARFQVGSTGIFEYLVVVREGNYTLYVTSLKSEATEPWESQLPKGLFLARTFTGSGVFARTDLADDALVCATVPELKAALKSSGCLSNLGLDDASDGSLPMALTQSATGSLRWYWLPTGDNENVSTVPTFETEQRHEIRSGFESTDLAGRRVGIVGLGSAGSKVALSLARTGIRSFLLIDDDLFLPGNAERHTLDWRNVGEHKVDGVKAQLHSLSTGMTVDVARLRLSGQESSSSVAYRLRQLSQCDIIVDATANPRTFNVLAEVARQSKTPMVWLEVMAGGIAGLVARSRPGKDPDPFTARSRLLAFLADKPEAPGQAGAAYESVDAAGEPVVATDADVSIVAHHAARVALDILAEREPSSFPSSLYLMGLERGWIFEAPFHTIAVDLGEPLAEAESGQTGLFPDTVKFVGEVISRHVSNRDTATNRNSDPPED